MIGLDTNILVRYLTEDDDSQFGTVISLLDRKGVYYYISNLVFSELRWVLALHYHWKTVEIVDSFERLLQIHNLVVQDEAGLRHAFSRMRRGSDLLDELIAADCRKQRCGSLATFDAALAKRWKNWAFVPK